MCKAKCRAAQADASHGRLAREGDVAAEHRLDSAGVGGEHAFEAAAPQLGVEYQPLSGDDLSAR